MKFIGIVLLLLAGQVWADECDSLPPPSVTVKRLDSPVTLNTSYDYKSITVLGSAEHQPKQRVLGLTRGTSRIAIEIKTRSIIDPSGRWECVSPQIVMSYGFSPMTIYVAKEFPPGGCAYNEIYQHELRHVKTYQAHLAAIEKDVSETLTRRFATGSALRAPVGQTRMSLEKELNERWMPYIKREIERVESSQALIDTPEEYSRVSESCNGEIKRVVR